MSGTVVASIAVCVGIKRYTIVVPTFQRPRLPITVTAYFPTWVELSVMAGSFATFALLYMLFTRIFPIVSLWEIREGREEAPDEVAGRIRGYFPATSPPPTTQKGRSA